MAIKNTASISVSKLLEDNNSKTQFFSIPKYQREYTWGKQEWNALFYDILENGKDYFLGSIICVCNDSISSDYPVLEVIDGQQRITTLSILLAVLFKKVSPFAETFIKNKTRYRDYLNLEQELYWNDENICKPRLVPQLYNRDDFNYVLSLCGLGSSELKPKNFGKRKISKAYQFFLDQINLQVEEERKNNDSFDECTFLFDLIEKFNSAVLVDIEVSSNRDAYMLFESLNNRGVPLSAIDLIKNHLIRVSDKEKKDDVCFKEWRSILSNLTDEYGVQERFFRQFYNAFRKELNAPFVDLIKNSKIKFYLGPLATRTTLLGIYEKLIEHDYASLLHLLQEYSKIYAIIINNSEEVPSVLRKPLMDLERIQGAPSYILLLYLFAKRETLKLDDEIIRRVIDFLIKFFVRRNVTDSPGTRNLTKIFMDTVDLLESKTGMEVYDIVSNKLKKESSSIERFEEKLNGKIYDENVDAVRFLLNSYEERFLTKERNIDLWKRDDKNKYVFTIEHIFPEGENIPDCWVDMIADGDKTLAKKYQEEFVHTFGNLTLTGFNSNLSNKAFKIKKNYTDGNQLPAGYNNGFKLNELVFKEDEWTIEKIQNRTKDLVKFFLETFDF